jgi:2-oxo-4-hydroxy-4-carboxy-5-ureidoimidazoline decarboxylase
MTFYELNRLDRGHARAEFLRCCGSTRWAEAMTDARPFEQVDAMLARGEDIWRSLGPPDWLEAFAAHPKIGERRTVSAWSAAEQAGMQSADDDVRARIERLNAEYEQRFGFIFIVCATGKAPAEMLAALERRIANQPENELPLAAEEQRKITALRLAKLVDHRT